MIDINYNDPTSVVRSNIGDPNKRYVSDNTITSALTKNDGNIDKASILIMETMLTHFSIQADESRTDDVWYKFTKLYERFKSRLDEFKNSNSSKHGIPIIIGGTRISEKNAVVQDIDSFLPHLLDDWRTLQEQVRLVDEAKARYDNV